ncbi:carboxypeptidase regulatory-like domain-containing protein [Candidatus Poribacteria bacterium]|nr:carboxypeptidase regulatory-like domain-containing protein [Candidatus Poribacteria bacterium]
MKHLSLTLILASMLIVYGAVAIAQDATTGTVRGNVVDTTTAQTPISGVRVVVVGTDGTEHETTTDDVGEYSKSGLPPDMATELVNRSPSLLEATTMCR